MTIGHAKQVFGFDQPDSFKCLNLSCKMGILENDDDIYHFKIEEILEYFKVSADEWGLDNTL